jgi:hypothetical protein
LLVVVVLVDGSLVDLLFLGDWVVVLVDHTLVLEMEEIMDQLDLLPTQTVP